MNRFNTRLAALALPAAVVFATPSFGLARIWISGKGTDAAGCGAVARPCRTLQFAHNAVDPAGEIDVLDAAGYGAVTITKAVSIVNDGVGVAGVLKNAAGAAITIAAGPNDRIFLRGLSIDGAGLATRGIDFVSGKELSVKNCSVRRFTGDGVRIAPSAPMSFALVDTLIADNGGTGLLVAPTAPIQVDGTVDRLDALHNDIGVEARSVSVGFGANGISGFTKLAVANSTLAHNVSAGLNMKLAATTLLPSGPAGQVLLTKSNVFSNGVAAQTGGVMNNAPGGLTLAGNDVWSNIIGVMNGSSAVLATFADNRVYQNAGGNHVGPAGTNISKE